MDWFNTVDLSYRSEMRELFETHFQRFEARLAQQAAELRSEFRQGLAEVRAEHAADSVALRTEMAGQFQLLRNELAEHKTSVLNRLLLHSVGTVVATLAGLIVAQQLLG